MVGGDNDITKSFPGKVNGKGHFSERVSSFPRFPSVNKTMLLATEGPHSASTNLLAPRKPTSIEASSDSSILFSLVLIDSKSRVKLTVTS